MGLPFEFYIYVGYGLFAMFVVYFGLNFLLGGLLGPFMKVKSARGKKVLVTVRTQVQDYFVPGEIVEDFLVFEDRQGEDRRLPMVPGVVSRAAGVHWVTVDDAKNTFIKRETGAHVSGYDAVKIDSLLKRAIYKPLTMGDNLLKIVVILSIVSVVLLLVIAFFSYKNYHGVREMLEIVRVPAVVVAQNASAVIA